MQEKRELLRDIETSLQQLKLGDGIEHGEAEIRALKQIAILTVRHGKQILPENEAIE